jgi:hypothetical protein
MELGIRRRSLPDRISDRTQTGLKSLRDLTCFGVPGLHQTRLRLAWAGMGDPSLLRTKRVLPLTEFACSQQEGILEHVPNLRVHYPTPVSPQTSVSQDRPNRIVF